MFMNTVVKFLVIYPAINGRQKEYLGNSFAAG